MIRYPSLFATMISATAPAAAHPGGHGDLQGAEFTAHVGQSLFHIMFLAAAGVALMALAIALFRGHRRRQPTSDQRR